MYVPNVKSVVLPAYEIIAIDVWGVERIPILGREVVGGRGWYSSKERW